MRLPAVLVHMLSAILLDLRSVLRTLRHARGFTGVAIGTLGFGLTLCITALTVANAYLLRTLPYPAADRLYSVRYAAPGQDGPREMEALDWPSLADVVEQPIAWDLDMFSLLGGSHPEPAAGAWVTPGFLRGFGVEPAIGRGLTTEDFAPGRPSVALISHALWQRRFQGAQDIIGREFQAYVSDRPEEAETFTIVGVLPATFWHVNVYTEVLAPLRAASYPYMVRLREGVTPEAAAQRITTLVRSGATPPATRGPAAGWPEGWRVTIASVHEGYVAQLRPMLLAIGAAAGLVLLIACANVAVLLLVRASRREKEMAVRLALGASRGRLARLLLLEGLVLGGAATAVGVAASHLAIAALAPTIERQLGRPAPGGTSAVTLDLTVLLVASAAGLITTTLFMLMPLIASWRTRATLALPGGARGATDGPARQRARTLLIVAEVAGSLALLAGAALMVDSALRMLRVDFGLEPRHVLTASVGLRQRSYPDASSRSAFYERVLAPFEQATPDQPLSGPPDARATSVVALGDWWPLQPPNLREIEASRAVEGDGRNDRAGHAHAANADMTRARAGVIGVSAEYFAALGIPVRDGRAFTARDRLNGEPVVIVCETIARRLWPGGRAVGQALRIQREEDDGRPGVARGPSSSAAPAPVSPAPVPPPFVSHRVVGVVGDVRQTHTDEDFVDIYVPLLQRAGRFAFVYARAAGASPRIEATLRDALASVDPQVSMGAGRWLEDQLDQQRARPRFLAGLLAIFATFAGLLALVGMYGAIAYAVRQREREIAVRMAIGADRRSVLRLFLGQGAIVLGTGLVVGLGAAVVTGRLLETQLYGVRPGDPRILLLTAFGFGACGLVAIWWPARRAAATDPAVALKDE